MNCCLLRGYSTGTIVTYLSGSIVANVLTQNVVIHNELFLMLSKITMYWKKQTISESGCLVCFVFSIMNWTREREETNSTITHLSESIDNATVADPRSTAVTVAPGS